MIKGMNAKYSKRFYIAINGLIWLRGSSGNGVRIVDRVKEEI